MYKFVNRVFNASPSIVVKNQKIERAIDCVEDSFVLNKYGHIRSDFAILVETSSQLEYAKALQNMQVAYEESSSQFDGMTFEEMVKCVRPRWCQLPGEVDRFEQYLIDEALDFYKKLRADEEQKLEDDEQTVNPPATLQQPAE